MLNPGFFRMTQFFPKDAAQGYDQRNSRLASISENLHFLIRLILKDLPTQSRILCVGIGTGAEMLSLANAFPAWTFVGVDPSLPMLEVCRERLEDAGVSDRCELVHGYVQDVSASNRFDAVLSILVAHFVARKDRNDFYKHISERLRSGGSFVTAEISFDLNSREFPEMLKQWEKVQALMGATPEKLATLPQQLKESLTVLSSRETEAFLQENGFQVPVRFFQAFMISGWYATQG